MRNIFLALCVLLFQKAHSQCADWNAFQTSDSLFTNPIFGNTISPEADKLHRPLVYLAMLTGGIKIYNTNTAGNPYLVSSIPTTSFGNLDVINLYQDSIWLYACLGNIWDTTQLPGLAIIDVSNPANPIVLDYYIHLPGLKGGAGAVAVKGNYAYLAANKNGLIILDISNKSNIQAMSALGLSTNFPHSNVGSPSMYNARGIAVKDQYAYICYDRGGLRVVDVSSVFFPVQVHQYCFPALINKATAYNNIVLHHNLAFVSIDYYGVEILDITNPTAITQLGWWHPSTWADTTNNILTWANSKGHANELAYDSVCNKLYVAAGKSDVVAIDVSNPALPNTCQTLGSTMDAYGTWGLDFFDGQVIITYIWSPLAPPYSNYLGFKVLETDCQAMNIPENNVLSPITLSPNPSTGKVCLNTKGQKIQNIKIYNIHGELVLEPNANEFSISHLPSGKYIVKTQVGQSMFIHMLVKQ